MKIWRKLWFSVGEPTVPAIQMAFEQTENPPIPIYIESQCIKERHFSPEKCQGTKRNLRDCFEPLDNSTNQFKSQKISSNLHVKEQTEKLAKLQVSFIGNKIRLYYASKAAVVLHLHKSAAV